MVAIEEAKFISARASKLALVGLLMRKLIFLKSRSRTVRTGSGFSQTLI